MRCPVMATKPRQPPLATEPIFAAPVRSSSSPSTWRGLWPHRRDDLVAHDLLCPASPDPALAVVRAGKDHHQAKLGDDQKHLAAVPGCGVGPVDPLSRLDT